MPSQRKLDSARANGAKAAGRKSPEGVARSAMNALKHGLAAHTLVLPDESHELFDEFADSLRDSLNPRTPVQHLLVQNVVAAAWRQRRYLAFESTVIAVRIEEMRPDVDQRFTNPDPQLRGALAFQSLVNDGQYRTFIRYDAHLDRQLHRALNRLENQPVEPQPANLPNDANPTNEHQPRPYQPPADLPAFLAHTPPVAEPNNDQEQSSDQHVNVQAQINDREQINVREQTNDHDQTIHRDRVTNRYDAMNWDQTFHHDPVSGCDLPAPINRLVRTASGG